MGSIRPIRSEINLSGWVPEANDIAQATPRFDTLAATADDLRRELVAGRLTSTEIVKEYYRAIFSFNGYLNAVYELAPGALKQAESLDAERARGEIRGPLHGIPILLKVGSQLTGLSLISGLITEQRTTSLLILIFKWEPEQAVSLLWTQYQIPTHRSWIRRVRRNFVMPPSC
jgi:hypothetical protein